MFQGRTSTRAFLFMLSRGTSTSAVKKMYGSGKCTEAACSVLSA